VDFNEKLWGLTGYTDIVQENMNKGTQRSIIKMGAEVDVVEKHNQRSGELTRGFVAQILTKSPHHPHGIKVRLETGEVGRVKAILEDS
tara:strand:- start:287 stop:550 length:264 start_codon:yes stop_codon:yes gene_type:complete